MTSLRRNSCPADSRISWVFPAHRTHAGCRRYRTASSSGLGEPWGGGLERTTLESPSRKVYPEVNLTSPFSREGPDVVAATESARPPVAKPKFQVH